MVRHTPLEVSERLSGAVGGLTLLKREDIQVCRSYKVRGAYNLISSLTGDFTINSGWAETHNLTVVSELFTLTGRTATLFRAPYGELDARVVKLAADMGLTGVQYDLASGDPDPRITTKQLIDYVSDVAKGGSIITT